MGYEVKRVALNFQWPLEKRWKGFMNPHPGPPSCPTCQGEGLNGATREIGESFYDHGANWRYDYRRRPDGSLITGPLDTRRTPFLIVGQTRRWCNDITQDEVDELVRKGRLHEFTHRWDRATRTWIRDRENPTAAAVNTWNASGGLGHDAVNRWILVEARARRLGVYGICLDCKGRGEQKIPRKAKKRYKTWKEKEPPAGPGWQIWETVSEGSPITPVFADPRDLIEYMADVRGQDRASTAAFLEVGWVPTMVGTDSGDVYVGMDAAVGIAGARTK